MSSLSARQRDTDVGKCLRNARFCAERNLSNVLYERRAGHFKSIRPSSPRRDGQTRFVPVRLVLS